MAKRKLDDLRFELLYLCAEVMKAMRIDEMNKRKRTSKKIACPCDPAPCIVIDGLPCICQDDFNECFVASAYLARKWRSEGMPFHKKGKCIYYNIEECRAWFLGE